MLGGMYDSTIETLCFALVALHDQLVVGLPALSTLAKFISSSTSSGHHHGSQAVDPGHPLLPAAFLGHHMDNLSSGGPLVLLYRAHMVSGGR